MLLVRKTKKEQKAHHTKTAVLHCQLNPDKKLPMPSQSPNVKGQLYLMYVHYPVLFVTNRAYFCPENLMSLPTD